MANMKNIPWKKSERFERIGRFKLSAVPAEIFPLLCPVLEYDWLPGWTCTMYFSDCGFAEKDAIFHTRENLGKKVVWTCIAYEPDTFIEYLMVSGTDAVVRLSIRLEGGGGGVDTGGIKRGTEVTWRMLFTLTSSISIKVLGKAFSEAAFNKMMTNRKRELQYYLDDGRLIGIG